MKKCTLLNWALSGLLLLSSCGTQIAPSVSKTGAEPPEIVTTTKDNPLLAGILSSTSFQKALTVLTAENVEVKLNTVSQRDNGDNTAFLFSTSRRDLALYAIVSDSGDTLIQLVSRDEQDNSYVSDVKSSRTYKFNQDQKVIASGWAIGAGSLKAMFTIGAEKVAGNPTKPNLSTQSCTVPDYMYTDLYFAQNDAQNAADSQVAAAAAFAAADFSLFLCFGGPGPCAAAVTALGVASWNLNNASKNVTTANKKVQEQMRRINEWRRINCG